MDQLCSSPNIIDLNAIVVNQDNSIHGFLMPNMHTGNLEDALVKIRRNLGVPKIDDDPIFDWSLKITWARDIVSFFHGRFQWVYWT